MVVLSCRYRPMPRSEFSQAFLKHIAGKLELPYLGIDKEKWKLKWQVTNIQKKPKIPSPNEDIKNLREIRKCSG